MIRKHLISPALLIASLSACDFDCCQNNEFLFEEPLYCEDYCDPIDCTVYSDPALPWPHKFTIEPEIYFVKRERQGGTTQTGWVSGGRFSYERIKRCSLYWGVNGLYAEGYLKGNTSTHKTLKSNFIDKQIEARIGYNYQSNSLSQPSFIPYVAIGYFSESNNYVSPSPVIVNFEIQYPYFAFGFVSSFMIRPFFQVGLNFEGKAMYDTKCKVTNDPEYDSTTMYASDRFNYRIEGPIIYRIPYLYDTFEVGIVPFYELRRYGGRENYPFDFLETRVNIYGFNIQFNIRI